MPDTAKETSNHRPAPVAAPQAPAQPSDGKREGAAASVEIRLLEASLDVRATLRAVVTAVVPSFADWCFVDLVGADGIPQSAELACGDPAKADLAAALRTVVPALGWAPKTAQAIRDPAPRLIREVANLVDWAAHDDRQLAALRRISPNSIIAAPLVARDRPIGTLTLIRSWTAAFEESDIPFVERLAAPAALALDNARWLAAEQAARKRVEREIDIERHARAEADRAVRQLRRLESVTGSLTAALSPATIAKVAFEDGLSFLDCSSATIAKALDDGRLEILFAHGGDCAASNVLPVMEPDAPVPVAEAYRVQTAVWIESPQALAASHPSVAAGLRTADSKSWAAVPLQVDARTVGALAIGLRQARRLADGERAYLLAVAHLVAQALERARLREIESRLAREG